MRQSFIFSLCFSLWSNLAGATEQKLEKIRRVYLNGIDITSAKHQFLEKVNIKIDGEGHIFIEAPHYDVNEESVYIPLSSYNSEMASRPEHRPPGLLSTDLQKVEPTEPLQPLSKQVKPIENPELPSNEGLENNREQLESQ